MTVEVCRTWKCPTLRGCWVAELAELLKVKPRTIYEMVAQNRIPYRKPPGSNILRFDLDEILAWTKASTNK